MRRKNFLATLVIIIVLWGGVGFLVFFVDPSIFGALALFFLLFFLALLFTLATLFANTRSGFIAALALTFFLILRYFGLGNILNLFLIAGVAIAFEIYFTEEKTK
jgi:hypothetical protein